MGAPMGNKNAAGSYGKGTRKSLTKRLMSIKYNTKNKRTKKAIKSLTSKINRRKMK